MRLMSTRDFSGELRATALLRLRAPTQRGARQYWVGGLEDDVKVQWTCEGPRLRHEHLEQGLALKCARDELAKGTWEQDLPPTLASNAARNVRLN
jgi:hypothetical protein